VVLGTTDGEEGGLQGQVLVPGPLLLWNSPEFFEALEMLLTLLPFSYELILGQFFKQFRLGDVRHEDRIDLRYDGRESNEIRINRPPPVLIRDGSLKQFLGEIGVASHRTQ
jgi:hypothetical protein